MSDHPDVGEFQSALKIDRDDLDTEISRQPVLFCEVGLEHVLTVSKRDFCYDEVKRVAAKVDGDLRKSFIEEGVKFTEGRITSLVLLDSDYIDSQNEYRIAKAVSDAFQIIKESFSQRSYALKDLVHLHTMGYMAESSISSPIVADFKHEKNKERLRADRENRARRKSGE